jgi:hypothetical protein
MYSNVCCIEFASSVTEKPNLRTKEVIQLANEECSMSKILSNTMIASGYNENDEFSSVVQKSEQEKEDELLGKEGTYEVASRGIFRNYKMMVENQKSFLQNISSINLKLSIQDFEKSNISWSNDLAGLALNFQQETAPCDDRVNS